MLQFNTDALSLNEIVFLDKDTAKRQYMFNINGMVHGQPVFSEVIFYMMKGGKLINCLLGKINGQLIEEVDTYMKTG
jgi:hypothetical protein